MVRSFLLVHISDLHLDGTGRLLPAINDLTATIAEKMAEFAGVPDRILLITGDLVSEPTPRALAEALSVVAAFRQSGLFTDIQAVAGNHDAKRHGLLGRRHDAYDYLGLPRTSKSVYYRQSGLDLVLLDSTGAGFADGNVDQRAYRAMVAHSSRLSAELAGRLSTGGRAEHAEPAESLVRVLALHHHPLPQATGEGKRFLGNPDEPMMYLASPATFLEAATSLNVDFILHGHRHVEGLTRYSIPDPRSVASEAGEEFWRTIYVLSCPSSTGQGGDSAGFNIIHFGPADPCQQHYRFSITRYSRPRNDGGFNRLDSNLPQGVIRLPAGRDFERDPAFQSAIDLASCETVGQDQVTAFIRRLLQRRPFYDGAGQSWAHALYTYLVTSHAWEHLARRLPRSASQGEAARMAAVRPLLDRLIAQSADVLGIAGEELDDLRSERLIHRGIIRELPRTPREGIDLEGEEQQRRQLLRALNEQVRLLGVELDLGGEPPADAAQ